MKKFIKRYLMVLIAIAGVGIFTLFSREAGLRAIGITAYSFKEMALVLPPIFILLGLLDVWVPRETMVRFMGEGSGLKGVILAIVLGSAAAGPLYGAFPVAAVFMKKGVKFSNILIFIGAWSTTKIPMFLFEVASLGAKFAVTRLLVDIPGIIIIALLLAALMPKDKVRQLYENAEKMN
ncbi:MAG: permease [Clostridia bacterium]